MQIQNLQTGEFFELVDIEYLPEITKIHVLIDGNPFVIVSSNEEFKTSWQ